MDFSSLREIRISYCPVKKLFMPALLTQLQSLEKIHVDNCDKMVKVIGSNDGQLDQEETLIAFDITNQTYLYKLRVLELEWLPELKSFCGVKEAAVAADSLHTLTISRCPKLSTVCFLDKEPCPPPSLQRIKVERQWWEPLQWDCPDARDLLQHLPV